MCSDKRANWAKGGAGDPPYLICPLLAGPYDMYEEVIVIFYQEANSGADRLCSIRSVALSSELGRIRDEVLNQRIAD